MMRPLGGVTYISTYTGISLHPIVKPFEMGTYWGVIKRSIFLFDHRMSGSWDFGHFSKTFDKNLALGAANSVKTFFQKIQKNDENDAFLIFWWRNQISKCSNFTNNYRLSSDRMYVKYQYFKFWFIGLYLVYKPQNSKYLV